jgi:hypothetical protein
MDTAEVCDLLMATLGGLMASPSVGMPRIELTSPSPAETDNDLALERAKASRSDAQ